ncbi:MAG TPA: M48 family metallopeptidase [Rhodanobacteraceae bacterium]|nr:M48 family metallopeptidase [Rhodanobacteraceae bacterium]
MIHGTYYDGRSSRPHAVRVECEDAALELSGPDVERRDALAEIRPSAKLAGVPYTLRYADGAWLQLPPDAPVGQWFPHRNRLESWVDRLERHAGIAGISVLVVALALVGLFGWGVPAAADYAGTHLPASVDRVIGRQSLELLSTRWLAPSKLPAARRTALQARFRRFLARVGGPDDLELRFYDSRALGANAFALGGGIIVVTDAIVKALPDDDAFLAVVAHEIGHQRHRHMLRMVLRGSGVAIVAAVLIGDVSGGTIATAIPAFLLNARYSREFEQQADDFALAALARAGISPAAFVRAMQALERAHPELRNDAGIRYLSSHPVTQERIARAQAAARIFLRAGTARATH